MANASFKRIASLFGGLSLVHVVKDYVGGLRLETNETIEDPRSTGPFDWATFALTFVLPALAAVALCAAGLPIRGSAAGTLLSALAILAGLLFNLLALLFRSIPKPESGEADKEHSEAELVSAVRQSAYQAIAYSILVALTGIVLLAGLTLVQEGGIGNPLLRLPAQAIALMNVAVTGVTYFVMLNFVMTLLVVLNRVTRLAGLEVSR